MLAGVALRRLCYLGVRTDHRGSEVQWRKSGGTGGWSPSKFRVVGIEYLISPKFDLLRITLLTEVGELDQRVAAMKSARST